MSERDFGWREVKMMTGGRRLVEEDKLVGYCNYGNHKGYLLSKNVKKKNCLGKKCRYFTKIENSSYWNRTDTFIPPSPIREKLFGTNIMYSFGEIYMAEIPEITDFHIRQGISPVLILSNNTYNKTSPVVTVVPIMSKIKKDQHTHVRVLGHGLEKDSVILCEHIMLLDNNRLIKHIGTISDSETINKVENAIINSINTDKTTEAEHHSTGTSSMKYCDTNLNERSLLWLGRVLMCNRYKDTKRKWCEENGVAYKTLLNRQTQFRKLRLI